VTGRGGGGLRWVLMGLRRAILLNSLIWGMLFMWKGSGCVSIAFFDHVHGLRQPFYFFSQSDCKEEVTPRFLWKGSLWSSDGGQSFSTSINSPECHFRIIIITGKSSPIIKNHVSGESFQAMTWGGPTLGTVHREFVK
jgi:hypothetical protein